MKIEKKQAINLLNKQIIKKISFPTYFSLVRIFFLVFILSIIIISCNQKDFTDLNVQPDQDKLGVKYITVLGLRSFTMEDEASIADERVYSLLGSYIDPVFGKCEAGFMSQFYPSALSPNFKYLGISPTIDSVVLSLAYYSYYGDVGKSNGIQRVNVYELSKDISFDNSYKSNLNPLDFFDSDKAPIASKLFWPQPAQVPVLRIKLNTSYFGKKIMGLNAGEEINLSSNELFIKFFKGLYIKTDNGFQKVNQGGILYFNLENAESKITAYYHDNKKEAGSFDYIINGSSARINIFKHNYGSAPQIQNQLMNPSLGQQQIYVQAMAGLRSKIEIPFLKQLIDSTPVAINKAEIIFKIDEPFTGKYVPNDRLFLSGIDSSGKRVILPDVFENAGFSGDYYGGYYDENNKQYRFNIARYVQQVITKKITDYGLYLETASTSNTANRVVLKGGNNIQFNLTYTKL